MNESQTESLSGVVTLQQSRDEKLVVLPVSPEASREDVQAATCSCVNHLCGCS